jgi:hypothetical protein
MRCLTQKIGFNLKMPRQNRRPAAALDGDTIIYSWVDGVSDWWVDDHPAIILAERADTWNDGNPNYSATTMETDHYHGRGIVS